MKTLSRSELNLIRKKRRTSCSFSRSNITSLDKEVFNILDSYFDSITAEEARSFKCYIYSSFQHSTAAHIYKIFISLTNNIWLKIDSGGCIFYDKKFAHSVMDSYDIVESNWYHCASNWLNFNSKDKWDLTGLFVYEWAKKNLQIIPPGHGVRGQEVHLTGN